MVGLTEGTYEPAQRTRNRVVIGAVTTAGIAACILAGFATSWPIGNAIASASLVLLFGACLWWMFASKKAGPVTRSDESRYWGKRFWAPFKPRSGPTPKP